MNKIPVSQTIGYAVSFAFGQFLNVLGIIWLPLAVSFVLFSLTFDGYFQAIVDFQTTKDFSKFGAGAGPFFLVMLVSLFLYSVMFVGLARQALGLRTGPAFVHFAAGRREWRMFGHMLLVFLIMMGVAIVLSVVIVMVFKQGAGLPTPAALALQIVIYAVIIWLIMRFGFLVAPVVAAEDKGGIGRSWSLMGGNVLRGVAVAAAFVLPLLCIQVALQYLLLGDDFLVMYGIGATPPTTAAEAMADTQKVFALMQKHSIALLAIAVPLAVLLYGSLAGASAAAYRALVPPGGQQT